MIKLRLVVFSSTLTTNAINSLLTTSGPYVPHSLAGPPLSIQTLHDRSHFPLMDTQASQGRSFSPTRSVKKLYLGRTASRSAKFIRKTGLHRKARRLTRSNAICLPSAEAPGGIHSDQFRELRVALDGAITQDNTDANDAILLREIAKLHFDRSIQVGLLANRESIKRAEAERARWAKEISRARQAGENRRKRQTRVKTKHERLERKRQSHEKQEKEGVTGKHREEPTETSRTAARRVAQEGRSTPLSHRSREECERQEQERMAQLREEKRRREEAQKRVEEEFERKQEELRRVEAARRAAEELQRQEERERQAELIRVEAARRAMEELQRQEELRRREEERRQEALRRAEAARRAIEEEERRQETLRREAARQAMEDLRREEEKRRQEELRRAEMVRQTVEAQYALYEAKWAALKGTGELPPVTAAEFPWPVLNHEGSSSQTPYQRIGEFVFHPQRPGMEGKTQLAKLKKELLRWHGDKFNASILPRIAETDRQLVGHDAEEVTKVLSLLKEGISG